MATQLAAVMPGLGLDPSESKLSISHTCAPPRTPTIASSAATVLAHCHYNQELRLWDADKLEGNPCSLEAWFSSRAVGWPALGRENSGKSLVLTLAHMLFLPQGSYLHPLWRKARKMGNELEAGEVLRESGRSEVTLEDSASGPGCCREARPVRSLQRGR